jgi:hypothetical protein
MQRKAIKVLLILFVVLGCQPSESLRPDFIGVWEVQQLEFSSPTGTEINPTPQPGQAIFTRSHYSLTWMPGETGMRAFRERWIPTEAEMVQRYGEIVVNSGVYEMGEQGKVTLRPTVSRVPEFMRGGYLLYEYRVLGDTLWLTSLDEYSFDGVQAPWAASGNGVTLRLSRVEDSPD